MQELDRDYDAVIDLVQNFVPFEVATLAKRKGFNYKTLRVYDKETQELTEDWDEAYLSDHWERDYLSMDDFIAAPSQEILKMWLKDAHNIEVWAQPYVIPNSPMKLDGTYSWYIFKDGQWVKDSCDYQNVYSALDDALQEALDTLPDHNVNW